MKNNGIYQLLGLLVSLMCSRLVQGWCDPQLMDRAVVLRDGTSRNPSLEFFMRNYIKDNLLTDICVSEKLTWLYPFTDSYIRMYRGDDYKYERELWYPNRTSAYQSEGEFKLENKGNYISWTAVGGPPDREAEEYSGRIFILDIDPPPRWCGKYRLSRSMNQLPRGSETLNWSSDREDEVGGSYITYYSCFDEEDNTRDNIYIVQTPIRSYKKEPFRPTRGQRNQNARLNRVLAFIKTLPVGNNAVRPVKCRDD